MKTPPPISPLPQAARAKAPSRPSKPPLRVRSPILAHFRANLLKGLITAIPLFLTVYIIYFIYGLVTKFTKFPADWLVDNLFPAYATNLKIVTTPFLAVLISVFIVYILGLLGTFLVGRQILAQIEHFIENLPLIKGIYGTTKQVISVFRQGGAGQGFQRVVLVEFPRNGTWTLAFVTNTIEDPQAKLKLVCCFIPMTPNPTSGFFQMFPEDQIRDTNWSVDMGIKIVLSGGLLAPHQLDLQTPTLVADPKPESDLPRPS